MHEIRKKIILLGSAGVGKTSLIRQFVVQTFNDNYLSSIGVRVDKKLFETENHRVQFMIWDIAGEINSSTLLNNYLNGAAGIFGVFDLTRIDTYYEVLNTLANAKRIRPDARCLILGNKCDLISTSHIDEKIKLDFLTSAKTGKAVNKVFQIMAEEVHQQVLV